MKNDSAQQFKMNLTEIYNKRQYNSISEMAKELSVPYGTLKCWMSGNRNPKITSIDQVANKLGCFSYNLIKAEGDFMDIGIYNNDSHKVFVKQLKMLFIKHQIQSNINMLYLMNNIISYDTLVSYLRLNNFRLPTLRTLDKIADELNISAYELVMEEI